MLKKQEEKINIENYGSMKYQVESEVPVSL
jgi:hypothetical protein